jgi:SAM-dependent methyltransferase
MYDDFSQRFLEKKSGRLLDVGCGLGFFVRKAMEHPQWSVWGYEISPKAVDYGRNKLGLANIYEGKVEENNFQKNSFDIITMWDVIEHLPDPAPVLSACFESLKQGGILFIHTPNVNVQLPKAIIKKFIFGYDPHIHFLEAKDHINIYSPKTIKVLLDKYGFSNIEFIHLHPIQSVSGSKHGLLKLAKNFWFNISVIIFYLSFKRINIDNLFVVAKKERTKKINLNFLI